MADGSAHGLLTQALLALPEWPLVWGSQRAPDSLVAFYLWGLAAPLLRPYPLRGLCFGIRGIWVQIPSHCAEAV